MGQDVGTNCGRNCGRGPRAVGESWGGQDVRTPNAPLDWNPPRRPSSSFEEDGPLIRNRWIPVALLGLLTGSIVEPVVASVCAERAHPAASVLATAGHDHGTVSDLHDGQPAEHPGHGSGGDHCMHQHGLVFAGSPGSFDVTSLALVQGAERLGVSPPKVALSPPFHPPRS